MACTHTWCKACLCKIQDDFKILLYISMVSDHNSTYHITGAINQFHHSIRKRILLPGRYHPQVWVLRIFLLYSSLQDFSMLVLTSTCQYRGILMHKNMPFKIKSTKTWRSKQDGWHKVAMQQLSIGIAWKFATENGTQFLWVASQNIC